MRRRPTGVTSLKLPRRPRSTLPLVCLSLPQDACCDGCLLCLGESGRFKALSSQVDLVGLHLLGSIVLETGVVGLELESTGLSTLMVLLDLACKAKGGLLALSLLPETEGVVGRSSSFG